MMTAHVIIVAAGSGARFGSALPKQYCLLAGRPVLMHTIARMREALPDAAVTLVLSSDMRAYWQELCAAHDFVSPPVVDGGATRSESVARALAAMPAAAPDDVVLVHDGARPLVDTRCVRAVMAAMAAADVCGAMPVVPVTDSLRELRAAGSSDAIDRSRYRAVQTPQAFRAPLLREAYARCAGTSFSDDASLMEHCGYGRFVLTEGSATNIKITNPLDLAVAEAMLAHI